MKNRYLAFPMIGGTPVDSPTVIGWHASLADFKAVQFDADRDPQVRYMIAVVLGETGQWGDSTFAEVTR